MYESKIDTEDSSENELERFVVEQVKLKEDRKSRNSTIEERLDEVQWIDYNSLRNDEFDVMPKKDSLLDTHNKKPTQLDRKK